MTKWKSTERRAILIISRSYRSLGITVFLSKRVNLIHTSNCVSQAVCIKARSALVCLLITLLFIWGFLASLICALFDFQPHRICLSTAGKNCEQKDQYGLMLCTYVTYFKAYLDSASNLYNTYLCHFDINTHIHLFLLYTRSL